MNTCKAFIKLEKMVLDRHGKYEKAKLKDSNCWIKLTDLNNKDEESQLQNSIDNAVMRWHEDGRVNDFISVAIKNLNFITE